MSDNMLHVVIVLLSVAGALLYYAHHVREEEPDRERAEKKAGNARGIALCCAMAVIGMAIAQYLHTNVSWW